MTTEQKRKKAEYDRAYRATHKEERAAYRAAHKAEIAAQQAAWRATHVEERKAYMHAWHQAHAEERRADASAWAATHPEERRARAHASRAKNPEQYRECARAWLAEHPGFVCWWGMLQRTTNPKCKEYRFYGAIGVTVCDRWNPAKGGSFEAFLSDLGPRPSKRHSLSRTADSGNYEPGNVIWGTRAHQAKQKRLKKQALSVPERLAA